MIRVFSRGIRRIPHLERFLGEPVAWGNAAPEGERAVAGWGLRPSARRAIEHAERNGLPYLALEDGFLRSVFPGPTDPPLSLCVDDLGIYYDASRPSRLERLIAAPLSEQQTLRARALIEAWRSGRVSKYNHQREYEGDLPRPYVLVIDQTLGDASITHGLTTAPLLRRSGLQTAIQTFQDMLHCALENHPDCTIILKVHPDVVARRKRGHFDLDAIGSLSRVKVIADHAHPARLLEEADAVYTVTSQMGFEALLWNRPVRTFGLPFYAGWGLTDDAVPAPERRGTATLEQLVHAALIAYPRYVHPETGERCEAEDVLAHLALQRRMRQRLPETVYAAGFSPYKRPLVRRFCSGSEVRFVRSPGAVPADSPLLVWGARAAPGHSRVIRLEDGFLRSVGLGADLIRPVSWVMDRRGIYYDATRPSDLEHILATTSFPAALLERARNLRQRIVAAELTKYNVGARGWRPAIGPGRRVVLVPGQVETDASIAFGSPEIRRNVALLQRVRDDCPDAWIVYKPHPDVVAGLRAPGNDESSAHRWCDEVVTDAAIVDVLNAADEVHTLTSLTGFEALLRGKRVTCYGQPFYAGWGLTTDRTPIERRQRKLDLDELVAGTLILYPTYISRTTGRFTTPERALDELLAWRARTGAQLSVWRRALRLGLRLGAG